MKQFLIIKKKIGRTFSFLKNRKAALLIFLSCSLAVIGLAYFFTDKENGFTAVLKNSEQITKDENQASPIPSPEQVPVKTLSGRVQGGYYSQSLADVVVTAVKDDFNKSGKTAADGSFSINQLPLGQYTLSFTHPEYFFSDIEININEDEDSLGQPIHGFLTNPQPLSLSVHSYSDKNSNNTKDGNDEGLSVMLTLFTKKQGEWKNYQTIYTDDQGNYSLNITDIGEYRLQPEYITFYDKPLSESFVVDGYGGSQSFSFGYKPKVSQAGFTIYVFNDKNENQVKDSDEEYIHYQYAKILNFKTGKTRNVAVPPEGSEQIAVEYGDYRVTLIPENDSWAYYYKITKEYTSFSLGPTDEQKPITLGAHKIH